VNAVSEGNKDDSDPRVNPGLVKLYDTILQSLEQMRNLSIVDESVDLVPSVEARLAYAKAKRCA
jgi:signal recognition particle subunit SRP68